MRTSKMLGTSLAALLTIALIALPSAGPAAGTPRGAGTWTTNGPPTTTVTTMASYRLSGATVLASTTGGLYMSLDAGVNWTLGDVGVPVNTPLGVVVTDQSTTNTAYLAVGCSGIYKSIDAGLTWTPTGAALSGDCVDAIAVDPVTPSTVYAGAFGDGVYKSIDGGTSWTKMSTGLTNWFVNALVINPNFPNIVFAGVGGGDGPNASGGPIFKSTDSGATWTEKSSGFVAGDAVTALAIDFANAANVYAGDYFGLVYKTGNGGKQWSLSSTSLAGGFVESLQVDPITSSTVYAADYGGGFFASTDSGATWVLDQSGSLGSNKGVTTIAVDGAFDNAIYLGTTSAAYITGDPAGSWTAIAGLVGAFDWTVTADPLNPATLLTGTDGGVWRSADTGQTWLSSGLAGKAVFTIAFDPTNTSIVYAGTDAGIYRSTNGGTTWKSKNSGYTFMGYQLAGLALVVDPKTPTTLYAGANGGSGVYKSTNSAKTWTAAAGGIIYTFVPALAIDPKTTSTLYASGFGGGIYKTTNSGTSWTLKNSGLTDTFIQAFAVNAARPATVYAGDGGAGVFKTDNGGTSWTPKNVGLTDLVVNSIALDAPNVYVGTGGTGVFASPNGATSWAAMNAGLTFLSVFSVGMGLSSPRAVHAGTPGGGTFDFTLPAGGPSHSVSDLGGWSGRVSVPRFAMSGRTPFGFARFGPVTGIWGLAP